jgi:hypothetical protein
MHRFVVGVRSDCVHAGEFRFVQRHERREASPIGYTALVANFLEGNPEHLRFPKPRTP